MFLDAIESVDETGIVNNCLFQGAFLQFYRNTHEINYIFAFQITGKNLPCLHRDIENMALSQ